TTTTPPRGWGPPGPGSASCPGWRWPCPATTWPCARWPALAPAGRWSRPSAAATRPRPPGPCWRRSATPGGGSAAREGALAGDLSPHNEALDGVGALVGVDRLHVGVVAGHVVLEQDAV